VPSGLMFSLNNIQVPEDFAAESFFGLFWVFISPTVVLGFVWVLQMAYWPTAQDARTVITVN
jgi:hypothetical protein